MPDEEFESPHIRPSLWDEILPLRRLGEPVPKPSVPGSTTFHSITFQGEEQEPLFQGEPVRVEPYGGGAFVQPGSLERERRKAGEEEARRRLQQARISQQRQRQEAEEELPPYYHTCMVCHRIILPRPGYGHAPGCRFG